MTLPIKVGDLFVCRKNDHGQNEWFNDPATWRFPAIPSLCFFQVFS